jgi:hypothetical protein
VPTAHPDFELVIDEAIAAAPVEGLEVAEPIDDLDVTTEGLASAFEVALGMVETEPAVIVPIDGLDAEDDEAGQIADGSGLWEDVWSPTPAAHETEQEAIAWIETPSSLADDESLVAAPLADLVLEDFEHVADNPDVAIVTGARAGTPTYVEAIGRALTPLEFSPIPELDAAIEAGALAAARAEADPELVMRRPPFRLDPHDFILPGELPPLVVADELVDLGLAAAFAAVAAVAPVVVDDAADIEDADAFADIGIGRS